VSDEIIQLVVLVGLDAPLEAPEQVFRIGNFAALFVALGFNDSEQERL
jgi:hypothetical protein